MVILDCDKHSLDDYYFYRLFIGSLDSFFFDIGSFHVIHSARTRGGGSFDNRCDSRKKKGYFFF